MRKKFSFSKKKINDYWLLIYWIYMFSTYFTDLLFTDLKNRKKKFDGYTKSDCRIAHKTSRFPKE